MKFELIRTFQLCKVLKDTEIISFQMHKMVISVNEVLVRYAEVILFASQSLSWYKEGGLSKVGQILGW